jgi:hypothetical protein
VIVTISDTASIGYPSAARVPAAAIEPPAGQRFPAAGSVEAVSESLTSFYLLVRVKKIAAAWIFGIHESAFQL